MDGYDTIIEKDMCDKISYHGGIDGTTAVLFDGSALEGPILRNNKEFKASKTIMRETHEAAWTNPTPKVYAMSDLTIPEVVTQRKLNNYQSNTLITSISKTIKSDKQSLFVEDTRAQQNDEQNTLNQSSTCRAKAINDVLILADVDFGSKEDNANQDQAITKIPERNDFAQGWAC